MSQVLLGDGAPCWDGVTAVLPKGVPHLQPPVPTRRAGAKEAPIPPCNLGAGVHRCRGVLLVVATGGRRGVMLWGPGVLPA